VVLDGVPGINENTVKQALANLKASGDYSWIFGEVQAEIEREDSVYLLGQRPATEPIQAAASRQAATRVNALRDGQNPRRIP
jgi:hypothetical protein